MICKILILAATAALIGAAGASEPSASTAQANGDAKAALPPENDDADFAARGFIATSTEKEIRDANGAVVWDFAAYDFLEDDAPASVHPSLWRHAKLLRKHGLFRVHERIYQVRGFDVANMSIILGRTGFIIVDPLTSIESAKAALALARTHLGDKPVVAVIYTHSHADHFAGVRGVVSGEDVKSGKVRIVAPEGFLHHAVSENVIAGNAMSRRALYQFGGHIPAGPEGSVTSGIGPRVAGGTRSLIPPTETVSRTGETRLIDGVRFVFQVTPESEAPAEMHFHLPEFRALCLAENANATMHNVLTPRGALVRDAKKWADYLTEAARLFGDGTDSVFMSHAWPRFGAETVRAFIENHRDAYKYLHDQTVRMMNDGLTGEEIADRIALPETLAKEWYNRGYYGTMRHNSRAVYQRYMGWYDANPVNLNPLPKEETAPRLVALMGGEKRVRKAARKAMAAGDYRWAAELLDRAVFANPGDEENRALLAEAHAQMGYQAESAIWRNIYLMAAKELTSGVTASPPVGASLDFITATPTDMFFDLISVRLDPARTVTHGVKINFIFPERKETVAATIRNGVLVHELGVAHEKADAVVTGPRAAFLASMLTPQGPAMKVDGDPAAWDFFRSAFPAPDPSFAIVTP
jgi:alkyl sulfatase BDS1-like metallo-beta-lactamase superfamily hydrolase